MKPLKNFVNDSRLLLGDRKVIERFCADEKPAINNQLINGHLPHTTAKALCLMEENKDKLNSCSYFQKTYRIILEKCNMYTLTSKLPV